MIVFKNDRCLSLMRLESFMARKGILITYIQNIYGRYVVIVSTYF